MTVPAAIRELEKIEMIRGLDREYRLDHAITATQKTILGAFNMDSRYIKDRVARLSERIRIADEGAAVTELTYHAATDLAGLQSNRADTLMNEGGRIRWQAEI